MALVDAIPRVSPPQSGERGNQPTGSAAATLVNNVPVAYTAVTKTKYIDSEPAWAR